MYKRLIVLSIIIIVALAGLSWLGYRAVSVWSQGIEGTRISEFANVAELIRLDVKQKLDTFMEQEQNRPYTDYRPYAVPEEPVYVLGQNANNIDSYYDNSVSDQRENSLTNQYAQNTQQVITLNRSPLADKLEHGFAYFNFQINPETNSITSPNIKMNLQEQSQIKMDTELNEEIASNSAFIADNLIPVIEKLESSSSVGEKEEADKTEDILVKEYKKESMALPASKEIEAVKDSSLDNTKKSKSIDNDISTRNNRTGNFAIESLQNTDAKAQVQVQSRRVLQNNEYQNDWIEGNQGNVVAQDVQMSRQQSSVSADEVSLPKQIVVISEEPQAVSNQQQTSSSTMYRAFGGRGSQEVSDAETWDQASFPESPDILSDSTDEDSNTEFKRRRSETVAQRQLSSQISNEPNQSDIVEVIIEPFIPVVIPSENRIDSIFGGQVFMIRRVNYDDKEFIQGFQLNEDKLLDEVAESTKRFVRDGMSFELGRNQNENSAYTAILDFGFGHLLLNLFENDPGRVITQISHLQTWYFSIVSVVFAAVTMAMISLWLNAHSQIRLAQKKDDFVSAVSHELRTPLTSIRMHAEMLEKNWIRSEDKLQEYYSSMRTESERLSRLIENVLDFSRIQKGRKKYVLKLGDINKCVEEVVEMMRAYAAKKGFKIITDFDECREVKFDSDAVTQIIVNLLDNAIKYSANCEDKTVIIRTRSDNQFVLIEVEDHGPGIPHGQRKRIFQEFYRIGSESTRETTGSGLGLALVKRFAQAHNGFVDIISAKPTGSIFRVSLEIANQ